MTMQYDNSTVRRRDCLMDENAARQLLLSAEYGVLAMTDGNGTPYAVPVNYVWDGKNAIYLHCAPEGRKLYFLRTNNKVSFCVVGRVNLLPEKFTTEYESILAEGTATVVADDSERMAALKMMVEKLSPDNIELGMKYSAKSFHRVALVRITVDKWSGKRKRVVGEVRY